MEDHHPFVVVLEVVDRRLELAAQDLLNGESGNRYQCLGRLTPRRPGAGILQATSPDVLHPPTVRPGGWAHLGPHQPGRDDGSVHSELLTVDTRGSRVIDLTGELDRFCAGRGDGLAQVFAPHATAGLALMEVGSGSEGDLENTLDRLLPRDDRYRHRHGTQGHGADHVLPALVSPSLTVPVLDGRPQLGTWQSLVLVDTNDDNPVRRVRLSFLAG